MEIEETEEGSRLRAIRLENAPWRKWGPYLSERQWGTVREDYSDNGDAWVYLSHDEAISRAYRWGEDGLAGISDAMQTLCFAPVFWNGKDPILKERLFGLTGHQGNHGEDVKEYYFYLDNLPSHAYMKHLYKYPHEAFPYDDLIKTNAQRDRLQPEYELLDTGIFESCRYFDCFTEYAKEDPEEILIRFTIENRGSEESTLWLLPTLWFRNTWSFDKSSVKPKITLSQGKGSCAKLVSSHPTLGSYFLYAENCNDVLFTQNETNCERLFRSENASPYVKDAFHDYFVHGKKDAVHPEQTGTKAACVYKLPIPANGKALVRLRLSKNGAIASPFGSSFDALFETRKKEADRFYKTVTPYPIPDEMRQVQRQAFSGLLWNKQCYHYNVEKWLKGDPSEPKPPPGHSKVRNERWTNLDAFDVISMPDKWEYPWFAAWDLAFHAIPLAMIDPELAKKQLLLLTHEWYMAPDGQIPAYEWNFSDVNPPVQAWAALRVYQIEKSMYGREDRLFLERMFQKLLLNFTWWINRKDAEGRNIFEGGFLGLDNVGAFDRSLAPPSGGILEQPDATGWMGMYCLNCLQIALELALKDQAYEDIATKFFEHFVSIADAINNITGQNEGLWDQKEGFYYSMVISPEGSKIRLKQDNMAGIVPLFAVATNNSSIPHLFPHYRKRFNWYVKNRADKLTGVADLTARGEEQRILLAFTNGEKLKRTLEKVLDEEQFLSPYGIRSVSKALSKTPFQITLGGKTFKLDYEPAESTTPLFGGNSNWRGPVWFPLNFLLIESLQKFHYYYDDHLMVECPKGSGKEVNLWDAASELSFRLIKLFLKDEHGRRPFYGDIETFQTDPNWKDYLLFHEYFNGDNGKGLGASNQTGWTALVAKLIHQYGKFALRHEPPQLIETEKIGEV